MNNVVLKALHLSKSFVLAEQNVPVLNDVSIDLNAGEFLAITGPSGAGKSTLLHLLGGLEKPTSGEIFIQGKNLNLLSTKELNRWRNCHLGFVYQFHHLLPEFSALENVAMPLIIRRENRQLAAQKAVDLLKKVGLEKRIHHRPSELSGGERQRCAIARAMAGNPSLILADEPTGNLDFQTGMEVFELLLSLCQAQHLALVVVTHDEKIAQFSTQKLHLGKMF